MHEHLQNRIDYGRRIRAEADRLLAEYGERARTMAAGTVEDPGLPEHEKAFRTAVAARVSRFVTKLDRPDQA